MLAKNPGFTAVAVLAVALGVGVNTVVFTAYDALALRPLPVKDPHSLVILNRWFKDGSEDRSFSYLEYCYYRDHNKVFSSLLAEGWVSKLVLGGDSNRTSNGGVIYGQLVSGNFFSV